MGIDEGPFQNITTLFNAGGFTCRITLLNDTGGLDFYSEVDIEFSVDWGDGEFVDYNTDFVSGNPTAGATEVVFVTSETGFGFGLGGNNATAIAITGGAACTALLQTFQNKPNIASLADITMDDSSNVATWNSTFRNNAHWDNTDFASITDWDFSGAVDLTLCFGLLTGLTSFPSITFGSGAITFTNTWNQCTGLTSFPSLNLASGQVFSNTWFSCSGLTSFPAINFAAATSINTAWRNCSGLTSFPLITFSTVAFTARQSWEGCSGLTTFPAVDFKNCSSLYRAWYDLAITSFGSIDCDQVTDFERAWFSCGSLASFPALDMSAAVTIEATWQDCVGLTGAFPSVTFTSSLDIIDHAFDGLLVTSYPAWSLSGITSALAAFAGNTGLTGTFPFTNFAACLDFRSAFLGCTGLTGFGVMSTGAGLTFGQAFKDCSSVIIINGLDTRAATTVGTNMFSGMTALTDPTSGEQGQLDNAPGILYTYTP